MKEVYDINVIRREHSINTKKPVAINTMTQQKYYTDKENIVWLATQHTYINMGDYDTFINDVKSGKYRHIEIIN